MISEYSPVYWVMVCSFLLHNQELQSMNVVPRLKLTEAWSMRFASSQVWGLIDRVRWVVDCCITAIRRKLGYSQGLLDRISAEFLTCRIVSCSIFFCDDNEVSSSFLIWGRCQHLKHTVNEQKGCWNHLWNYVLLYTYFVVQSLGLAIFFRTVVFQTCIKSN